MTSINALSSASSTYRLPPPGSGTRPDPMAAVADKLGLSSSELKTQLQDGKSLNEVATAQGVSHDDLLSAIRAGMPKDTNGAGSIQSAEKIATTKGLPPPPPSERVSDTEGTTGPGGTPKGQNTGIRDPETLGKLSDLLGMDKEKLSSSATSATKLVEMLQKNGVDLGQLRNVMSSGGLVDVAA
ncbi:hypothetical protein [Winogradskya humida]|uniref:LysM domain-containing protein n=1 Tax=Winogradskya humida TaxID=113566 RepID=A0ABQ3ZTJ4_9ACTN|nr:hypothetical protein [Actinoplanes humidus]GIE21884.1 hypothetical protein Ahu01nite_049860 [Actinoplanes humidus]